MADRTTCSCFAVVLLSLLHFSYSDEVDSDDYAVYDDEEEAPDDFGQDSTDLLSAGEEEEEEEEDDIDGIEITDLPTLKSEPKTDAVDPNVPAEANSTASESKTLETYPTADTPINNAEPTTIDAAKTVENSENTLKPTINNTDTTEKKKEPIASTQQNPDLTASKQVPNASQPAGTQNSNPVVSNIPENVSENVASCEKEALDEFSRDSSDIFSAADKPVDDDVEGVVEEATSVAAEPINYATTSNNELKMVPTDGNVTVEANNTTSGSNTTDTHSISGATADLLTNRTNPITSTMEAASNTIATLSQNSTITSSLSNSTSKHSMAEQPLKTKSDESNVKLINAKQVNAKDTSDAYKQKDNSMKAKPAQVEPKTTKSSTDIPRPPQKEEYKKMNSPDVQRGSILPRRTQQRPSDKSRNIIYAQRNKRKELYRGTPKDELDLLEESDDDYSTTSSPPSRSFLEPNVDTTYTPWLYTGMVVIIAVFVLASVLYYVWGTPDTQEALLYDDTELGYSSTNEKDRAATYRISYSQAP